jgi:hypothetical protein
MLRVAIVAGVAVMITTGAVLTRTALTAAQRPALLLVCLHDERSMASDRDRRDRALEMARALNAAQGQAAERTRRYQPLSALSDLPAVPDGFDLRFYTDGEGYVFSLKDTRDPCHYGIFSDQHGRIYEATPQVPLMAT